MTSFELIYEEKTQQLQPLPTNDNRAKHLLRALVDCVKHEANNTQTLLDMEVDGRRYLLICDDSNHNVHLSPREAEVAYYLVKGLLIKEVAQILDIKTSTVMTYVKRIYNKLSVNNRAEMVAAVLNMGLVSLK